MNSAALVILSKVSKDLNFMFLEHQNFFPYICFVPLNVDDTIEVLMTRIRQSSVRHCHFMISFVQSVKKNFSS